MCFIDRSLEQVTSVCAMCKVFPPRNNFSCPHKGSMAVCKNRTNHPRHDVLYFRNAELSFFNGCGFCKWAKRNPKILLGDAAWKNPGWPGCCRPPKPQEYDLIASTDWYAVSRIHAIPAPPTMSASPPSPRIPINKSPTHSPPSKNKPIPPGPRTPERRNSGSRDRTTHPVNPPSSSSSSSSGLSPPTEGPRRRSSSDVSRKPESGKPQSTIRESTATRSPRVAPTTCRKENDSKSSLDDKDRRASTKTYNMSTIRGPPPMFNPPLPRPVNPPPPKPAVSTQAPPSVPPPPSASSSSSSSCSSMNRSGTVTSEGFTDYLSDESELEVQREAEKRAVEAEVAALIEKQRLESGREEQEFRAARIQLASMGLQPPSVWSTGKSASPGGNKPSETPPNPHSQCGGGNRATRSSLSDLYRPAPSAPLTVSQ